MREPQSTAAYEGIQKFANPSDSVVRSSQSLHSVLSQNFMVFMYRDILFCNFINNAILNLNFRYGVHGFLETLSC